MSGPDKENSNPRHPNHQSSPFFNHRLNNAFENYRQSRLALQQSVNEGLALCEAFFREFPLPENEEEASSPLLR